MQPIVCDALVCTGFASGTSVQLVWNHFPVAKVAIDTKMTAASPMTAGRNASLSLNIKKYSGADPKL